MRDTSTGKAKTGKNQDLVLTAFADFANSCEMALKSPTRPCSHCGGSGRELDPRVVGGQMRELRLKMQKSLRMVAERMGIKAPYLSDLERGNRAFNDERIARFKEALK